jgi:hypothetical protein
LRFLVLTLPPCACLRITQPVNNTAASAFCGCTLHWFRLLVRYCFTRLPVLACCGSRFVLLLGSAMPRIAAYAEQVLILLRYAHLLAACVAVCLFAAPFIACTVRVLVCYAPPSPRLSARYTAFSAALPLPRRRRSPLLPCCRRLPALDACGAGLLYCSHTPLCAVPASPLLIFCLPYLLYRFASPCRYCCCCLTAACSLLLFFTAPPFLVLLPVYTLLTRFLRSIPCVALLLFLLPAA